MRSKKNKLVLAAIILVVIFGAGAWFIFWRGTSDVKEVPTPDVGSPNTYTNAEFGFSFVLPDSYQANETDTADGAKIITVADKFQIYITPFDEPDLVLTAERVQNDIPDMTMENIVSFPVSTSINAISFNSDNPDFNGNSYEIWFVKGKNLFQISGYAESKQNMEVAVQSWKFE